MTSREQQKISSNWRQNKIVHRMGSDIFEIMIILVLPPFYDKYLEFHYVTNYYTNTSVHYVFE